MVRRLLFALGMIAAAGLGTGAGAQVPGPGDAVPQAAAPSTSVDPQRADRAKSREAIKARRGQPGTLVGHGGPVKALAGDPATGRVLTGSFDYSLMVWDVTGEAPRLLQRIAAFEGAVNAVAFVAGSDRIVAGGDDGSVWVWQVGRDAPLARLTGHIGKINGIAVSGDGRFAVSSSWDRTARIWDLVSLKAGPVLSGHKGPVNASQFSGDGRRIFTASYDGTIAAWNAGDGAHLSTVYNHGWGINVLARIPGGDADRLLFGALNGAAGIVDASGGLVHSLPGNSRPVLSLAITAKPGLAAVGSGDGTIQVLRLGDWAPIETFHNPFGPVWAMAFVADGTALYYGSLDDFALRWQVSPRAAFEPVESQYPRRFQIAAGVSVGERQFARKCSVCHTLDPDDRNRAGPTLHGVFGRRAGSVAGYPYSDALKASTIVWNEETIGKLFEQGPEHFTPGSKMPLQRISDAETRQALIVYLKSATSVVEGASSQTSGAAGAPEPPKTDKP